MRHTLGSSIHQLLEFACAIATFAQSHFLLLMLEENIFTAEAREEILEPDFLKSQAETRRRIRLTRADPVEGNVLTLCAPS